MRAGVAGSGRFQRTRAASPALRGAIAIVDLTPKPEPDQPPVVRVGQWLAFRLHNQSRQPLYVTVLQLKADYAIRRIYPDRAFTERIAPGAKTPAIRTQVGDPSTGPLRFKVIRRGSGGDEAVEVANTEREHSL